MKTDEQKMQRIETSFARGVYTTVVMTVCAVALLVFLAVLITPSHNNTTPEWSEGYCAGRDGIPATANPYVPGDDGHREKRYEHWAKGWQDGYLSRQQEQTTPGKDGQ